jgi:hypothetical protein
MRTDSPTLNPLLGESEGEMRKRQMLMEYKEYMMRQQQSPE